MAFFAHTCPANLFPMFNGSHNQYTKTPTKPIRPDLSRRFRKRLPRYSKLKFSGDDICKVARLADAARGLEESWSDTTSSFADSSSSGSEESWSDATGGLSDPSSSSLGGSRSDTASGFAGPSSSDLEKSWSDTDSSFTNPSGSDSES
jgi:hypothetical protein